MKDTIYRLQGRGLYLFSSLTKHTGRYHLRGMEQLAQAEASGKPIVLAAWHGMTMMLAGFFLNYLAHSERLVVMMPDDWRGQTLKHWSRLVNVIPFPMNLEEDNTLSMARQFVRLVRMVKEGHPTYVTPDGPDGPPFEIKPGVAYLAAKTGALLLPVGAFTRRAFRLNRWDQYVLPHPYARIHLVIGAPVPALPDQPVDDITSRLTNALHRVSGQAISSYYHP